MRCDAYNLIMHGGGLGGREEACMHYYNYNIRGFEFDQEERDLRP